MAERIPGINTTLKELVSIPTATLDRQHPAKHVRSATKLPPAVAAVPADLIRGYVHSTRVNNYLVGSTLGEGSYAKVKEGFHKLVGETVAMKIIDKRKVQQDPYVAKNFRRETKLLQMVCHPNIVQLFEVIETDANFYLIFELCSGGGLMKYMYKKHKLDENKTRKFMRQIVSAVDHLHKAGIIHRNLKMDNMLLDTNMDIKIIDFSLSNEEYVESEHGRVHCNTQCGSPSYAAPELLGHKEYGKEVDIWSIGVNMYAMLTGCLPYTVEPFNITALYAKMLENKMNPIPEHLSTECKDLLRCLLRSNPSERIRMEDIMAHPWMNKGHSLPFGPAPFPNKLKLADISDDIVDHMVHTLNIRDSTDDLKHELLSNRSTSATAMYKLLAIRLMRYQRQFKPIHICRPSKPCYSRDQGFCEAEDEDETDSVASSTSRISSHDGWQHHMRATFSQDSGISTKTHSLQSCDQEDLLDDDVEDLTFHALELPTDLDLDAIVKEFVQVAEHLKVRHLISSKNMVGGVLKGIHIEIYIKKDCHRACHIAFQWVSGGDFHAYKEVCDSFMERVHLSRAVTLESFESLQKLTDDLALSGESLRNRPLVSGKGGNGGDMGIDESVPGGCGGGGHRRYDSDDRTEGLSSSITSYQAATSSSEANHVIPGTDIAKISERTHSQSVYFSEAEKKANVPFLHHHLLECDHNGLEYIVKDHDITLRIPKGAVSNGEKVHFEIGVAMYGPFIFPENTRPISAIIWLCVLEDNAKLKKPFQLIVPHFLTGLNTERLRYHQVELTKANHNHTLENDQLIYYTFNRCSTKPLLSSGKWCKSYGLLELTHCCFYCLEAKSTPELFMDAGYCLARIEQSLPPKTNEVYFIAFYFLDTCIRALEEQFPKEEGYTVSRYGDFKFTAGNTKEKYIKVVPPGEHDQCVIALDPNTAEIRASDIDFWKLSFKVMKLRHEKKMYPPRVKMTVKLQNPDHILKLPIKFEGCSRDSQLNTDIIFPLGLPSLESFSSISSGSQSECRSSAINASDDKPKLRDVFKKLLPLSKDWKTIGGLLGVKEYILDNIKKDEDGVRDCLHAMLSKWLKQIDPPPTWKDLVDAVEGVDSSKAEEMRQYLAS